ncbi:MAG: hypothetical protein HY684_04590 [Chloroflexi bacterium]|nr:hypothetical protein [Chloroflexota bacterium]
MESRLVFIQDRRLEGVWPLILAPLIALLIYLASNSYVPVSPVVSPIVLVLIIIPGLYRIFWGKSTVIVDKSKSAIFRSVGPGGKEERLASFDQVQQADVAILPRGNAVVYRLYLSLKSNTKADLLAESGDIKQAHALASAINDAINLPAEARSKLAMSSQKAGTPYTSGQAAALWIIVLAMVVLAIVALVLTTGA